MRLYIQFLIAAISWNAEAVTENDIKDYFRKHAAEKIRKSETGYGKPQSRIAKNVILFLGDGMGPTVVTAGRIYKSQKESGNSVSNDDYQKPFFFENLLHTAMVKTHSYNGHVTDSAAAATAFFCGAKVPTDSVGVHWDSFDASGDSNRGYNLLDCIGKYALDGGKKVGVVTTTRLSHATPASLYAHHADRRRESGAFEDKRNSRNGQVIFKDIAEQLVTNQPASNFTVILGGGLSRFKPCPSTQSKLTVEETEKIAESITCRFDDKNLVDQWLNGSKKRTFVGNKQELLSVNDSDADQVLGIFSDGHLPYVLDRNISTLTQPNLVDMTRFAIEFLRKKSPNGYFLLVEGGGIDLALHMNKAKKSFEELIEFDNTVAQVMTMIDLEETLVIVTADHSHNLNLKGYASKAVPILSYLPSPDRTPILSIQQNWTMLTFADGPSGARYQLNSSADDTDLESKDYQQAAMIWRNMSSHGGEDVVAYASGPSSHLFRGLIENTDIFYFMCYALGLRDCYGGRDYDELNFRNPHRAARQVELHGAENVYLHLSSVLAVLLSSSVVLNVILFCQRAKT